MTSCGTGDPTAYTGAGGETNGDILTTDTFGTASIPNKDDLSNVYAAAHVSGATNEVFFGAERVINNGDSHIDFEFLQSAVTIPNACSGSFTGDRRQGDFLLSVDFTNGGTLGGTLLYKWQCDTVFNAAHNGNLCNPTKKSQAHYQLGSTSAVTINVNAGAGAIGCGGWVCRNPDGTPTTTIAQNELMEGGIDLAQLGFTGCVSTFLPHTRSSQSFTATLKDFEIIPFNTCAAPTVNTQVKKVSDDSNVANNGHVAIGTAVYDTATLSGATPAAGGTVNYKLYTDSSCTTASTAPALDSTVTVTNAVVPKSANVTFTAAGTFYFQATYSGDSHNNVPPGGAKSACTSEAVVVDKNNPTIATQVKKASDDSDVANGASIPIGTAVYDTSALSGATSDAGGSVTYTLFSDSGCTTASTTPAYTSTVTVTGGSVPKSSPNVTFTKAGTYYFQATYTGDSNNTGPVSSTCSSEVVVVAKNSPTIATQVKKASDDSNVANGASIPIGTPVYDTAALSGATSDAGGTVTYSLYTDNTCTTASTDPVFSSTVTVASGSVPKSSNVSFTKAGTYYFQATYSGDGNNNGPVSSGCATEVVVVSPNSPGITTQVKRTSNDANVSNGGHIDIGTSVYDTAALSSATSDAGGTVTYRLFTNNLCTLASAVPTLNDTETVTNGVVPKSVSVTFTQAGTYYFRATYSGDANNTGPVSSGCSDEIVVVDKNSPTISTQVKRVSNDSNVANGGHVAIGTSVYDTASLSGATSDAGGTVTYRLFSDASCTTASTTPALNDTVTVTNGAVPNSASVTFTVAGTFYFRATYSGDANNNGPVSSGCSDEIVVVDKNSPAPHSTPVVQVKDTLNVTGLTSSATGNVVVGLYSAADCSAASQIGSDSTFTVAAAAGGVSTSFQVVTAGTYYYKIHYDGDANNNGFNDCGTETVTVGITSLP